VIPPGGSPPDEYVAFLDAFRVQWEQWFFEETEGLGTMETTIPSIPVTAYFRPDRFAGNAPLRVRFENLSGGVRSGFAWDFGALYAPSTQASPFLSFANGSHDVTLTVHGVSGPAVHTSSPAVIVGGFDTLYASDIEDASDWTVGVPQTSTSGTWQWGDPEGTSALGVFAQPEDDATREGSRCWVTGLAAGSFPSQNDVDGGVTTLLSPAFDLADATDPLVSYARWYTNYLSGSPEEDEFVVQVSANGGADWVDLERVRDSDTRYHTVQFRIRDFVSLTDAMRFRFQASDSGGEALVEAAVDDFEIIDRPTPPRVAAADSGLRERLELRVFPNPSHDNVVLRFSRDEPGPMRAVIYNAAGRLVRELHNDASPRLTWDGADATGRVVAAGVYTVVVDDGRDRTVRKIVRIH
jgi:hypothetical protein